MRITSLDITNFKAIRSFHLDDIPTGIIGVTGGNGQGKSTLLTAIAYAMYGPEVLSTGTADAVTWGERNATVRVGFEMDGHEYALTRSQDSKGTSKAALIRDETETASGPNAVNAEMEKLLGIDRVGFLASVFSMQEDLLGIGSLQPAKRTSTVLRLLGIDQIDAGIKKVNEKSKELRGNLDLLRRAVESIPDLDTKETRARIHTLTKEHSELVYQLENTITPELAKAAIHRDELYEGYTNWLEYSSKFKSLSDQLDVARADVLRAESALQVKPESPVPPEHLIDAKEYQKRVADYESKKAQLVRALNSTTCPTCGRAFDDAPSAAHIAEESKRVDQLGEEVEADAPAFAESERYRKDLDRYQMILLPNYEQAEGRLAEAMLRVEDITERIEALESWPDVRSRYSAAQEETRRLERFQTETIGNINALGREIEVLTAELDRFKDLEASRKQKLDEIKVVQRKVIDYATTSTELQSFKTSMVAGIIPYLSDRASAFITDLTDGRYTELVLTPQYEIQYRNDMGDLKPFATLSGGERDVFALALRLAIADLRAGNIGILVLDEVFESLDSERQELAWQTLEKHISRYDQIFVVTHVASFKDRAPTVISLTA